MHMHRLLQEIHTIAHSTPQQKLAIVALRSLQQPSSSPASAAWEGSWLEGAFSPRTTCVRGCVASGDATFSALTALWPAQMEAQCTAAS